MKNVLSLKIALSGLAQVVPLFVYVNLSVCLDLSNLETSVRVQESAPLFS